MLKRQFLLLLSIIMSSFILCGYIVIQDPITDGKDLYEQTTNNESDENSERHCGEETTEESEEILSEHEDESTLAPSDEATEDEVLRYRLFLINGDLIPIYIQSMLYNTLARYGIEYWYEIALCQMYQESHGNVYAENPNGLDKGLFQYRITYWDWSRGDIFDPAAQIELYAEQMARRLNSGLSVEECISRHMTSDYCTDVNWQYVSDVKQWLGTLQTYEG